MCSLARPHVADSESESVLCQRNAATSLLASALECLPCRRPTTVQIGALLKTAVNAEDQRLIFGDLKNEFGEFRDKQKLPEFSGWVAMFLPTLANW